MHSFRHHLTATLLAIALGCTGALSGADLIKGRAAPAELIAALRSSEASLHDRARACQIAGEIGCIDAVPALAALLADPHLATYARSGLENIPDSSASAALITALGTLSGDNLAGVIDSLGALRNKQAVPALIALTKDTGKGVATHALAALGRIASDECIATILGHLASTDTRLRAAAAEVGLFAAEQRRLVGDKTTERAIYEACRTADVPALLKGSATCAAILTGSADAIPLLLASLDSSDLEQRRAGLRAARRLDGQAVTKALVGRMHDAQPAERALLIGILVDRGGPEVIAPIALQAKCEVAEIRTAAIKALARCGTQEVAPILTEALDGVDATSAMAGLTTLKWAGLNDYLLTAMNGKPAGVRARIIGILAERRFAVATPTFLAQATDADATVATAALKALGCLAQPEDMDRLIAVSLAAKDEGVRSQAERAINLASQGNAPDVRSAPVIKALGTTTKPADRALLVRILGVQGSQSALATIQALLKDADEQVREAAFRALEGWPNAAPIATMITMAADAPIPAWRILALRAGIRMAGTETDTGLACG